LGRDDASELIMEPIKTITVRRFGHPLEFVTINEADFNPEIEERLDEAGEVDAPDNEAGEVDAEPKRKAGRPKAK
jgi:hypothetical protein